MMVMIRLGTLKLWKWYKSIAVEIAALLFMASVLMTYLITQDFIIDRVCRVNLGYSEDVCEAVIKNTGEYELEESNIQKVMTQIRRTRSILDYSIPIIFVIFHGSWSDIYGRKLPLLLPCLGFILQALSLFMSSYFNNWDGYAVVLISTIPKCISGSDVTFRMAALSHVSDISTEHSRTVRTGLISAAFTLGVPIGFALGGASVKASIPAEVAFLISAGICTVALLHILIFVDNKKPKKIETTPQPESQNHLEKVVEKEGERRERKCFTVSNIKSILRSLVLSFEGVATSTRIQIFMMIFVIICINAPIQGEFGVMYLYLRKKLTWDSGDYGIFSTYVSLIGVIGTIMSMGILCSLLKLSDPVIGFIAGISQFCGSFMYAFAYNNTMIYLAPAIDMLNGTMAVVAKSMLSKLCPPESFGKMFSFLAVIELLVPLIFDPTYSTIYFHTLDTFPGTVFLLSAVMTVPPQITFMFYAWRNRNAVSCDITPENDKDNLDSNYENNISSESFKSKNLDIIASGEQNLDSQSSPVTLKSARSTSTVNSVMF